VRCLTRVLGGDECPVVRHEAAFCLGRLGGAKATRALTKAMLHDPDPLVRHEAAEALGDMANEKTRQALSQAESDQCEVVRRTAVLALQELELQNTWMTRGKKLLTHKEKFSAAADPYSLSYSSSGSSESGSTRP